MNSFLYINVRKGSATIYIMQKNGKKQYVKDVRHNPIRIDTRFQYFDPNKDEQRQILMNNRWLKGIRIEVYYLVYMYGYDKVALVGSDDNLLNEVKKELQGFRCQVITTSECEPLEFNQLFSEQVVDEDIKMVTDYFQSHIDRVVLE